MLHFSQRRFVAPAAAAASDAVNGDESFDLEVCNHGGKGRAFVSVAYYDVLQADWVARGWFPQPDDSCQLILKNLPPPVYVYAETRDGVRLYGDTASDGAPFCVDGEGPFIWTQQHCSLRSQAPDARYAHFKELAPPSDGHKYTWEIGQ